MHALNSICALRMISPNYYCYSNSTIVRQKSALYHFSWEPVVLHCWEGMLFSRWDATFTSAGSCKVDASPPVLQLSEIIIVPSA